MMITACTIRPFRIPFREPVSIAGNRLAWREGLVIGLRDRQHRWGFGEVSPLKGLDRISPGQCREELCRLKNRIAGKPLQPDGFDPIKPLLGLLPQAAAVLDDIISPHVCFGVESALLHLSLQHRPALLQGTKGTLRIPINGLFSPDRDSNASIRQFQELSKSGFKTVKVKIGRLDPDLEIDLIRQLSEHFKGRLALRLDGNRLLDPDRYKYYSQQLASLHVEYAEEPLPADFRNDALSGPWPLALDESLAELMPGRIPDLNRLPDPVRHIILKPSAAYGIHGLYRLMSDADQKHITTVLSSAFNTGLGIIMLGLLSHMVPGRRTTSHGLDTLKAFNDDLLQQALPISGGNLQIPTSLYTESVSLNSRFLEDALSC